MTFENTYPALHSLGLTASKLLTVATDSDDDSDVCAAVGVPVIIKKAILELHIFMKSNPSCTYYTLWKWMACLFKDKWSEDNFPTLKSIRHSVLQIASKVAKLRKLPASEAKDQAIANFLAEEYSLPKVFSSQPSYVVAQSSSTCSSCSEFETMKEVNKKLCQEIGTLKEKIVSIESNEQILSDYRHKRNAVHRNLMKKVKRRDGVIQQQKDELKEGEKIITSLHEKVDENEVKISLLKAKMDRLCHRASYWKKKSDELIKESADSEVIDAISNKDKDNQKLRGEISDLEHENSDLCKIVDELMDDSPLVCFVCWLEFARKREKELRNKEELTLKVQRIGLWTSADDVETGLSMISSRKAKTEALKLQLNFRKKVLNQSHADKTVFQFSHNRQAFSVEQLKMNLLTLVSGGSSQVETNVIDQFLSKPEKLEYRRIEHLFESEGEKVWFKGTVLSFNAENQGFTVLYDNEDEAFNFPLLEDLKNSELRIVS